MSALKVRKATFKRVNAVTFTH